MDKKTTNKYTRMRASLNSYAPASLGASHRTSQSPPNPACPVAAPSEHLLAFQWAAFLAGVLLLWAGAAHAGQGPFARFGIGMKTQESKSHGDVKTFNLGYQGEFGGALSLLDYKWEAGGWIDNVRKGRKHGGFVSGSVGVEPRIGAFYANAFVGLAAISPTDAMLGSVYQFVEDFGFGVGDQRKVRVGLNYKHISNAGIKMPNRGRDFLTLQVQFPW